MTYPLFIASQITSEACSGEAKGERGEINYKAAITDGSRVPTTTQLLDHDVCQ